MFVQQKAPRKTGHESGFTMMELIMVIVIMGILSAFAAPKFMDISGDAENAASQSMHGTFQSTMAMAFAKHRAAGLTESGDTDGQYITDCTSLAFYLEGEAFPDGVTCTGDVIKFTNGQEATITAEATTNDAPASLSALADADGG